jgi:succinate dehydrogenase / fumarate reductase flavoprotein subunit
VSGPDRDVVRADVVVVGAGAAGMYAALTAQAAGADVVLLDKSLIGRGGATIMAQMTVAAALGHAEPDSPAEHIADTLAAGRGTNDQRLVELLCEDGPRRILETRDMGVEWTGDGERLTQVSAPGHSKRRCCFVDVLSTGPSVSRGMRVEIRRRGIRVLTNVLVTDVVRAADGTVAGVAGQDVAAGRPIELWAPQVVLACGGLTEMFARNSASVNLTGDAYALALDAGADLLDIEMVQFFPIANLAPRTIGLDPIMWDPFRYKLGGRLLNGRREEFVHRYDDAGDGGQYRATRDVVSYAILKEVEEGRGSPHGGAYLDFTDIPSEEVAAAFPGVVEKLLAQGIDLSQRAVEVAPMAHYTIGGVGADDTMATTVPGLWAAGEAVGGAHGANRLSGNAITEAFVFGARAGESAAAAVRPGVRADDDPVARRAMDDAIATVESRRGRAGSGDTTPRLRRRLQRVMWDHAGPFRSAAGLEEGRDALGVLAAEHADAPVGDAGPFNLELVEWVEMRHMLRVAEAIVHAATLRTESRGAHQRLDHPTTDPALTANLVLRGESRALTHEWRPVITSETARPGGQP